MQSCRSGAGLSTPLHSSSTFPKLYTSCTHVISSHLMAGRPLRFPSTSNPLLSPTTSKCDVEQENRSHPHHLCPLRCGRVSRCSNARAEVYLIHSSSPGPTHAHTHADALSLHRRARVDNGLATLATRCKSSSTSTLVYSVLNPPWSSSKSVFSPQNPGPVLTATGNPYLPHWAKRH